MGFFDGPDGPVVEGQPGPEPAEFVDLPPRGVGYAQDGPPEDRYLPTVLPRVAQVGAGAHVRLMFAGWSVWPDMAELRLDVFWRRKRTDGAFPGFGYGPGGAEALRVGLLLADGRRVTTLDDDPWPAPPPGERPITLRESGFGGGGFHCTIGLTLSALPPGGPTVLVVEWPEEGVPETRTALDTAGLAEAALRATEIWPELSSRAGGTPLPGAVPAAVPGHRTPSGREALGGSNVGRGSDGWDGVGYDDWSDIAVVRARLEAGADPSDASGPLHRAAAWGTAEVVTALLEHGGDPGLRDAEGRPPLWEAVSHGRSENAAVLLAAGADPWEPAQGDWSPGRLALLTGLAPMFESLPGAVRLTAGERAAHEGADRLAAVFAGVDVAGLGVAFVAGIDEDEAIRRLGADPGDVPVPDLPQEPGPYGTGAGGFDPDDFGASTRFVGVTGVPGGCVVTQPMGRLPSEAAVLERLSAGTVAYGVHFHAAGGTFGTLARDGRAEDDEEIGLDASADDPAEYWLYRFWQRDDTSHDSRCLAYACARAGMRLTDCAAVTGPPRRWVPVDLSGNRHDGQPAHWMAWAR